MQTQNANAPVPLSDQTAEGRNVLLVVVSVIMWFVVGVVMTALVTIGMMTILGFGIGFIGGAIGAEQESVAVLCTHVGEVMTIGGFFLSLAMGLILGSTKGLE